MESMRPAKGIVAAIERNRGSGDQGTFQRLNGTVSAVERDRGEARNERIRGKLGTISAPDDPGRARRLPPIQEPPGTARPPAWRGTVLCFGEGYDRGTPEGFGHVARGQAPKVRRPRVAENINIHKPRQGRRQNAQPAELPSPLRGLLIVFCLRTRGLRTFGACPRATRLGPVGAAEEGAPCLRGSGVATRWQ
jgi:hypothetical protein